MKGRNKPILTMRTLITCCAFFLFTTAASAQLQFGGGAATVADFNQFGIQAKGQYTVDPTWRGSADFTFLFPEAGSAFEINANGHYVFSDNGAGQLFYAIGGLSIYRFSFDIDLGVFGGVNSSFTDVGFNAGAGVNIPLGGVTGYAEAKYAIGGSQIGLAVGVLFGGGSK